MLIPKIDVIKSLFLAVQLFRENYEFKPAIMIIMNTVNKNNYLRALFTKKKYALREKQHPVNVDKEAVDERQKLLTSQNMQI